MCLLAESQWTKKSKGINWWLHIALVIASWYDEFCFGRYISLKMWERGSNVKVGWYLVSILTTMLFICCGSFRKCWLLTRKRQCDMGLDLTTVCSTHIWARYFPRNVVEYPFYQTHGLSPILGVRQTITFPLSTAPLVEALDRQPNRHQAVSLSIAHCLPYLG